MEKQTLLEVLNYLKQECAKNNRCHTCQFYDNGCKLQQPPEEWKLKVYEEEEEKKWTPFRD